ncbi:hypothetical protein [Sphingomonas sp.]|uniref:hypothetical protein n=1 Tax=Sphingomonas sp. TaxID=28214 RepID=UPI0037522BC2
MPRMQRIAHSFAATIWDASVASSSFSGSTDAIIAIAALCCCSEAFNVGDITCVMFDSVWLRNEIDRVPSASNISTA